jgi:hypothetical protein
MGVLENDFIDKSLVNAKRRMRGRERYHPRIAARVTRRAALAIWET